MAELAVLAATSAGASAATAATIGTVASVGLTAASAFGAIQAGSAQSASLKLQAQQNELNAKLELLEGRRTALEIEKQLDRDLASQNAIFAARGTLAGEGSSEAAKTAAKVNASKDIDNALFNSKIASLNFQQNVANLKSDAKAAKKKGLFGALDAFSGQKVFGVPKKPSLVPGV